MAQDFVNDRLEPNHLERKSIGEMLKHAWLHEPDPGPLNTYSQEDDDNELEAQFDQAREYHMQRTKEEKKQTRASKNQEEFDNKKHWNELEWDDEAVCGPINHRKLCNSKWRKIFKEHHVFDEDCKNKHMLDLCTGWGRIIFNVLLPSQKYKFKSYTGVDFSMQSALKFYDYKNKYIESGKNYNVDIKI